MTGSRRPRRLALTLLLALGLVGPGGCGRKAPPRLADLAPPLRVADLRHEVVGEEVILSWSAPRRKDKEPEPPAGFWIYRAADPLAGDPCTGCPLLFRKAAEVPMPVAGDPPGLLTARLPLAPGYRYTFKVVAVDGGGRPAADSNLVTFAH
jgi:hypothetical protein